jgi:hypothetical protein
VAEGVRGKKDFWNGVMGGAAAGSVIGVRGALRASAGTTALSPAHRARSPRANPAAASLPYGVAAAAALAATSAVVDSTGQNLRGAFAVALRRGALLRRACVQAAEPAARLPCR